VVLVDPSDLDAQPVYDPVFTAARGVVGRDVRTVVVDGQMVMTDRQIVRVDEERLRATINQRWPRIMDRFEALVA
jgi:cytosine/adenosine deaminase-related metal-dependent hydrolase